VRSKAQILLRQPATRHQANPTRRKPKNQRQFLNTPNKRSTQKIGPTLHYPFVRKSPAGTKIALPSPPGSGEIAHVLPPHFDDHDHGGQDADFKSLIDKTLKTCNCLISQSHLINQEKVHQIS
jgi:hypothetical protein